MAETDTDTAQAPVLVLGLGNILLQDEGVGVAVIERLQRRYRVPDEVELLDGGTSGMSLLEDISNREHLIVVDAVRTGKPAGTEVVLTGEEVPAFLCNKVSPHQLALSDVLANLALMNKSPRQVTVVGMEPLSLDTHLGLSEMVTSRLQALTERVIEHIEAAGYEVEQLNPEAWNNTVSLMTEA
ncbi:MAG: HyaD/HybD family hydrogenase maturation endopeptidase [Halobacteria archaeon]|nr:HyaD/HybD family hydrogenase maturation endopeptidase [Halobacteria archaeon]